MTMKRCFKILAWLLTFIMVINMMPVAAFADEGGATTQGPGLEAPTDELGISGKTGALAVYKNNKYTAVINSPAKASPQFRREAMDVTVIDGKIVCRSNDEPKPSIWTVLKAPEEGNYYYLKNGNEYLTLTVNSGVVMTTTPTAVLVTAEAGKYTFKSPLTDKWLLLRDNKTASGFSCDDNISKKGEKYFSFIPVEISEKVTVQFNMNGAPDQIEAIEKNVGEEIELPNYEGEYSGRELIGWKADTNNEVYDIGEKYTLPDKLSIVFTAVWDNRQAVTFDANGGDQPAPAAITIKNHATTITLPDYNGQKEGYKFIGWSVTEKPYATINNVPYEVYRPGTEYTVQEKNNKLYAVWSYLGEVAVEFGIRKDGKIPKEPGNYNASSYSTHIQTVQTMNEQRWVVDTSTGGTIEGNHVVNDVTRNLTKLPTDEEIKAVYPAYDPATQYVLWYVMKKYESRTYAGIDGVILNRNMATVTYDNNTIESVNVPLGYQVEAGTTITVGAEKGKATATDPVRTGYNFMGWNTQADGHGTYYYSGNSLKVTENTTLYAIWSKGELKVTVKNNNAKGETLTGASFNLYQNATKKTSLNSNASCDSLENDTVYSLEEMNVPYGYEKISEKFYFKVASDAEGKLVMQVCDADGNTAATPAWLTISGATVMNGITQITVTVKDQPKKYNVIFASDDGKVLKASIAYDYGTPANEIIKPANPAKEEDEQYTYTFEKWDPEIGTVTGDVTYKAVYSTTLKQYTIRFLADDKTTVLSSEVYPYGTKAEDIVLPAAQSKAQDAQYTYTFNAWDVEDVTADKTYVATFTPNLRSYTITFLAEDGTTVLSSKEYPYGTAAADIELPEDQTRAQDAQYTYKFNAWDVEEVKGDKTYTASFTPTLRSYTITFANEDGTELQSGDVAYGETPAYTGTTPAKAATDQYSYTFAGWDKEIATVEGEATYTATYTETVNQYSYTIHHYLRGTTIRVKDDQTGKVDYDTVINAELADKYQELDLRVADSEATQAVTVRNGNNVLTIYYTLPLKISVVAADKTYGDSDPAELTAYVTGKLADDTVTYTVSRAAGEEAGTYDITAADIEAPEYYDITIEKAGFTIGKKAVTLTVDAKSKTYGDADPAFTASFGANDLVGNDTIGYTLTREAGEDVGAYAISTSITNSNYDVTVVPANLTIGRKAITLTVDAKSKTYGDADPAFTANFGENDLVGSDMINYVLSREEGEAAGTYEISTSITNSNYDVTVVPANLTIGKKAITLTVDAKSKTYGDADPAFTANFGANDLVGEDTIAYTLSRATGENVGTYAISTDIEEDNYDVTVVPADLTINQKAATIAADAKSKTYGAADPELTATVEGLVGDDTLSYSLTRAEGENVGEYAITVAPGENPNYSVTAAGSSLTIARKAATIKADAAGKTYGAADPELTATVEGLVGSDTLNYNLTRAEGENVGEYGITVAPGENVNYDVTTTGSTFTISKKAATITAADKSKIYGENDPDLTAATDGLVGDDTLNYSLVREGDENVGDHAITVEPGENPNYDVTAISGKLTIGKKELTITADEKSKTYGAADPTLTATVEGRVGNDSLDYTLTRAEGENVGEYTITVTAGNNPNYEVTTAGNIFTIGQKAATIAADAKSKTYGADDPALTATVEGLVGDDELDYSLTRAEGNDVGEYAITVTPGDNLNYDVTVTDSTLTINKKAATVAADEKSKTYGDDDPGLTATVEGLVGDEELNYTLSRAEGENAGEYDITVTLGENKNYDVTATDSTLTINRKAVTLTADPTGKTYGDAEEPELTATPEGLVGSDTLSYTLARTEGEAAGEYDIFITLGDNPNYDVTDVKGTFTIAPKAATVTADAKSKTYGTADPALTATVAGLVGSDTLDYELSRAGDENVGEHDITVTLRDNPNYDVTAINGTLTIEPSDVMSLTAEGYTGVYDQEAHAVTARATIEEGTTIEYSLDGETWTAVAPSITNVGRQTVQVRATNSNYITKDTEVTLEVTPLAATITANARSKIYGSEDPELNATVTGVLEGETLSYTLSREAGKDVGEYAITVTSGSNQNYTVTTAPGIFTITPKSVYIAAADKTKEYDNDSASDPELTATVTGAITGDTINYTLSREAGQNAGSYAITVTAGENKNYTVKPTGATFRITPKAIAVKADNKNKVYNNNAEDDPELTATVTGAVAGDAVNYTLSREAGEDVGDYAITVTSEDNPNYTVNVTDGIFSITPRAVTVKADDQTKEYDNDTETDPELTATVTNAVEGDAVNYTLSRAEGQAAGDYTITVTAGTNPNYTVSVGTGTFSITKKEVAVKAVNTSKVYDNDTETDPELTATVTGALEGEEANYTLSRVPGQDAGDYAITVTAGENPNYTVNTEGGTFSITPKPVTVKAVNKTKTYDNSVSTDPELTAETTGVVEGDTINYALAREPGQAAGNYAITVTEGLNPNYTVTAETGTFAITPKAITVKADDKTKEYDNDGSTDPELTATVTGAVTGDTIYYSLGRAAGQNAGGYAITVTAGENPNYTVAAEEGTFTITPKAITIKADDKTKVYNNNAADDPDLTATVSGAIAGDTVNYTVNREAGQNAGEYAITVAAGENLNYTVTAETGTFSITPKAISIKADDKAKVYDKDASTDPALTATVTGAIEGDTVNYTLSRAAGQDADSYAITVTAGENPNYTVSVEGGIFSITKKDITVKADNKTKVYDNDPETDPALTATVTGAVEGEEINYTLNRVSGQNVAEYAITVTAGENLNYNVTVEGGTFSVTPKAVTVKADDKTKIYNKDATTDPALTATVTGAVGEEAINYTLSREAGQDVNDYTITATAGANPNYTVTTEAGTFSITKKTVTVAADDKTKVYDKDAATDPALTATVTGAVSGDTINYTLSREAGQDAADYAITVTAGDNPNYAVTAEEGKFSITPKMITVVADDQTKEYDNNAGTDPELTATVSGAIAGDTVSYTVNREDGQNVGEYVIAVAKGENLNYTVTAETGTFAITPKAITIAADAKTKIYDNDAASDPELTATVTGAVEGDTINYTLSREAGQNADDYAITVAAGENPNYTVSVEGGTFSITKKGITVKADNKTKTYDRNAGTDPELTATVTGAVEGDTVNYELSRVAGQDADDYAITVTAGSNPNYAVTVESGTFSIRQKALTIKADNQTKEYDNDAASDPELTATVTGAVEGDTINYTLSRTEGQDVAVYTILVTPGENRNYDVTGNGGTFRVTPRAITITADDQTKEYDNDAATDPELTATVTGAVEGDTINYTLSRVAGQNAGEYTITAEAGTNPNYTVSVESGTFSVTPKPVTVAADNKEKVYDDDADTDPALTATVTGAVGEEKIAYTLAREEGQNAAEYKITVTAGENPNYTVSAEDGIFSITPKPVTVTAVDKTKVYDNNEETDPELTATVTGAVKDEAIDYTLSRAEGQDVNDYTITVAAGTNPNYTVTTEGGTFSITAKTITVRADNKSKTYDNDAATDPELTATVTNAVEGDEIQYTLSREAGQDADEYRITVTAGENPNYTVGVEDGTFSITPKAITIKADDQTKVYDKDAGTDPELTATVTDAVEGDVIDYTVNRAAGQDVNEYPIAVTPGTNPNYTVSTEEGTFAITPKAITIKADDQTKVYDNNAGTDPELTATVTDAVEGDEINYTVNRAAGQNVDDYSITVTPGTNPNYTVSTEEGTFAIMPKAITIKADDQTKEYDNDEDTDPALTATVTDAVEGDTINYTLSREEGQDEGTYPITVTAGENPNYRVTAEEGEFSVTKRVLTISVVGEDNDLTKLWGYPDPAYTVAYDRLVEGDTIEYTIERVSGEEVTDKDEKLDDKTFYHDYPINLEAPEDQKNYKVTAVGANVRIIRGSVTIDSNLDSSLETVPSGTEIILTAVMEGLDEDTFGKYYELQWQVGPSEDPGTMEDIPGANGLTYSYILNQNTRDNHYRVVVTLIENNMKE